MMQHKYPFTMLQFTIDPSYIDVNVHPAKMEIRFRDGEQIYRTVYHTIAMALANRELIPAVSLENEKDAEKELKIPGLEKGVLPELPTRKMESSQGSRPSLKPVRIREEHPEPFETKRLGASQAEMMSVSEDMPGYGAENGSGSNAAVSGTGRSMKGLEEPTQPAELKMFQLIQSQICQSRPRQRLPANPSQLQRGKLHLLHLFQRDRPSPPHLKSPVRWICLKINS